MVDDGEVVGEAVGLLEVLRREQDRGPLGLEVLDDGPQLVAAVEVEARRGLVQEQHRRTVDERGAQVEAPAHPTGVRARRPVGGVDEVELLEELGGAVLDEPAGQVREAADEAQILPAREVAVDGGELACETDAGAHPLRFVGDVEAQHGRLAGVGAEDRRQHPHGSGLAGAVGAEQAEHGCGRDLEVDAVERDHVAEALLQTLDCDG